MSEVTVVEMRRLRMRADRLNVTLVDDLRPFLHNDNLTFRRLPTSESKTDDVSVTTTSTCLMSLASSRELPKFAGASGWDSAKCFRRVVEFPQWTSSGLPPGNPFTSTLVLRAFGFLRECGVLNPDDLDTLIHQEILTKKQPADKVVRSSLERIIHECSLAEPTKGTLPGLAMGEYGTAAPVVYWFVDAVHRANHSLRSEEWEGLVQWASEEFAHQVSLTVAKHDTLKDPVAMAMAACLCCLLRRIAKEAALGATEDILANLPSAAELGFAVQRLFSLQEDSGIWPKYFPMFHYPGAGSNYCFTFELLEAILQEFAGEDHEIVGERDVFAGLEKAVGWCEQDRLDYRVHGLTYCGWNSGGQMSTLRAGQPESWATATVHMFLAQLREALCRAIRWKLLDSYHAYRPDLEHKENIGSLDDLVDIPLKLPTERQPTTLKTTLRKEIIEPAKAVDANNPGLERLKLGGRLSALLFGPPGTGKTQIAKAVAEELRWPFMSIDPSPFLDQGLEKIYVRADGIFADLMDLPRTVVLFDEMDALVRTREEKETAPLDITSRFLTTSMLPKLAKLHESRRTVFFMATNHQDSFDPAIKRPGRFDLLLCVGPPTWAEKLHRMDVVLKNVNNAGKSQKVKELADGFVGHGRFNKHRHLLDLFTFSEIRTFLSQLRDAVKQKTIQEALEAAGEAGFLSLVEGFSEHITLRRAPRGVFPRPGTVLRQFLRDRKQSRIQ